VKIAAPKRRVIDVGVVAVVIRFFVRDGDGGGRSLVGGVGGGVPTRYCSAVARDC
jgi:hypothetical protein